MKLYKIDFAGGGSPAYLHLDDDQVADWKKDERVSKVTASTQAAADKAAGIVSAEAEEASSSSEEPKG